LVVVGDSADACRDNIAALEITSTLTSAVYSTSAFTSSKCPQNLSPRSSDLPRSRGAHPNHLDSSQFLRRDRPHADGAALLAREVVYESCSDNKKPPFCGRFF